MRLGIGLGLFKAGAISAGVRIFSAFQTRVIGDGGTVEAGTCVVNGVNNSSILQGASFLLIPSGYKGGKLYSEIPTNGNGDLTWTRGSDAFRTNASGVLQRVPWNLLRYSEEFDNSAWTKASATVTANATTAPNGTLTADKVIATNTASTTRAIYQSFTPSSSQRFNFSVYAKASEYSRLALQEIGSGRFGASFDLSTQTTASLGGAGFVSSSITNVGNGWFLCSVVWDGVGGSGAALTTIGYPAGATISAAGTSYAGDGTSGIFIWGAQLVEGTTAQTYLPTTDRLNFPRLSYMYGSCPSALLEPQRTNLAQNSGFVGTGSAPTNWTQPGGTGTSSLTTSNLGVGVQACSQSATAQRPFLQQDFTVSANTTYTFSMYVESISGTINYNNIMFITNPPVGATTSYFLDGVSVNEVTQATTGRLSIRLVVGALTGTISMRCGLGVASSATGSLLFSRPQLEVGAYTTTFILSPVSATATRVADSFSRSNIYTNGLISASGGTWFVEVRNNIIYTRDAGNTGIFIGDDINASNSLRFRTFGGGARIAIVKSIATTESTLYITTTDTVKFAIKWNGSTADVFVNGVKQVSATAFTTTAMEFLMGNANDCPKFIQQMALFPTPLTDTQCQTITT